MSTEPVIVRVSKTDAWRINMIGCTDTICDEVAHPKITQRSVALSYALALRSQAAGADNPDWARINSAILSRWKMSGLERIKKRALDILSGKAAVP